MGSTQIASGGALLEDWLSLTAHKKEAEAKGCILCTGLFPEVLGRGECGDEVDTRVKNFRQEFLSLGTREMGTTMPHSVRFRKSLGKWWCVITVVTTVRCLPQSYTCYFP